MCNNKTIHLCILAYKTYNNHPTLRSSTEKRQIPSKNTNQHSEPFRTEPHGPFTAMRSDRTVSKRNTAIRRLALGPRALAVNPWPLRHRPRSSRRGATSRETSQCQHAPSFWLADVPNVHDPDETFINKNKLSAVWPPIAPVAVEGVVDLLGWFSEMIPCWWFRDRTGAKIKGLLVQK